MGSRKGSARRRERMRFEGSLPDMTEAFEEASADMDALDGRRERAVYEKSCASKRRYQTRGEALSVIRHQESLGVVGLFAYRCAYCRGYHLTSHPR